MVELFFYSRIRYLDANATAELEKLHLSEVPCVCRHQSVSNYLAVDLAVLKEMSQAQAGLFGLTLPVS
jgi:hypothetical protein